MVKVSVAEAAALRGISSSRVRAMIASDQLDAEKVAGRWLVEAASFPTTRGRAGQPYTPRNAWAFARLAGGESVLNLSPPEASRLRGRWRKLRNEMAAVSILSSVLARRGRRLRLVGPHPDGVLADPRVIPSGRSDPRSGMSVRGYAELYVAERDLEALAFDHLLVAAQDSENVLVRAVPNDVRLPERGHLPLLAVVADLADGGPREQQQAERLWDQLRSANA